MGTALWWLLLLFFGAVINFCSRHVMRFVAAAAAAVVVVVKYEHSLHGSFTVRPHFSTNFDGISFFQEIFFSDVLHYVCVCMCVCIWMPACLPMITLIDGEFAMGCGQ